MDKKTIARIVVFALVWVNGWLASKGYKTIPVIDETQVAFAIAFIVSVYTTVRHNFFGKKGQAQKEVLDKNGLK